jgi:hypothetical protein
MEQDNVLAVMGSPGSGKTTTAVKLALSLAAQKKNVILVFCDPFTPVIPAILPADTVHDTSLGSLLTAPGLTQTQILNACVPIKESEYISLLGYCGGESLTYYPKITRDNVVEFFVMLRHLADYIIIDCASVFEADPTSIIAIEMSDAVLKIGTANLKGISYFQTHSPMLADSRFRKETHKPVIGNLKVGQDWEAVSGQYGGVEYILPYVAELEQQDNELSLFCSLIQPESDAYRKAISSILQEIFSVQSASVPVVPTMQTERKAKAKSGFKLPFARSKGEF